MQKSLLTSKGKNIIEKELNRLISVDRERIKISLVEARALGDLKENAEYHSAKEEQSLLEGKIAQLQHILSTSEIIDTSKISSKKIVFGATVKLFNPEKDTYTIYQIVGHEEADSTQGKISINSPLAKALIGKEEGESVIVKAPKGDIEYEIDSFHYE
jgi:transcription elongation factor GreA